MCGNNEHGQLGDGTTEDSSTPIKIEIPSASTRTITNFTYLANEEITSKNVEFKDLEPNTIYNFYSVKAKEFESEESKILDSDNLLYRGQYTSDKNWNLKVTYKPCENYDNSIDFVVGPLEKSDEPDEPIDDTIVKGDANLDGKLNIRDAALIANKAAEGKLSELPECADYNEDGVINVRDAAAIARFLASVH